MEKGGLEESGVETLVSTMTDKLVVSVDRLNWKEAGRNLQWAVLLRLASGKAIQKQPMENIISKVWKVTNPATFLKVD